MGSYQRLGDPFLQVRIMMVKEFGMWRYVRGPEGSEIRIHTIFWGLGLFGVCGVSGSNLGFKVSAVLAFFVVAPRAVEYRVFVLLP